MEEVIEAETCLIRAFDPRRRFDVQEIAELRLDYPDHEGNLVARFFANRSWVDIGIHELQGEYSGSEVACLFFMRASAAAHFVSSYLRIAVKEEVLGHDIRCLIIDLLTPDASNPEGRAWIELVLPYFDECQVCAIRRCVECVRSLYGSEFLNFDFDAALARIRGLKR